MSEFNTAFKIDNSVQIINSVLDSFSNLVVHYLKYLREIYRNSHYSSEINFLHFVRVLY